jgi:sporulation protein YqfD
MIELLGGNLYSYERLRFTGLNTERILNIASENGIIIRNAVRIEYAIMEADVYAVQVNKLKRLLPEGYRVMPIKRKGLIYKLLFNRFRICLILGIIAAISLIYLYSLNIRYIEINGYSAPERLTAILMENGILDKRSKAQEKLKDIEKAILESDKNILWCDVHLNGTVAEVFVKESNEVKITEAATGTLRSKKACVIKNLVVTGGTAAVKNGDTVSLGQVLILPKVTIGENEYPVKAEGKAIASVWYSDSTSVILDETVYTETGNISTEYRMKLFGMDISSKSNNSFEHFITETENINLFGLPMKIERVTYKETIKETAVFDREQAIKEAEIGLINKLRLQIPSDAAVYRTDTTVYESDGILTVYVYIETVEDVLIRG